MGGKKKIDRKFDTKKINVHKQASYARVLAKCKSIAWGDGPDDASYEFVMLDSGGMIIPKQLIVDQPNGTDKALPWSLELYMMVNKKTYTCKPRFNVLRQPRDCRKFLM